MDFSNITDDQLLQLIKAVMAEAVCRGVAIAKAASDIHEDAAEELRIKAEVAAKYAQEKEEQRLREIERKAEAEAEAEKRQKEQEKIAKSWAHKSAVIAAFISEMRKLAPRWADQMEKGFDMNLWGRGSDVRLYIQEGTRDGWEVIVYLGGNQYNPPGAIENLGNNEFAKKAVLNFAQYFQSQWKVGVKFSSGSVANYAPSQYKLEQYIEAMNADELLAQKEQQQQVVEA